MTRSQYKAMLQQFPSWRILQVLLRLLCPLNKKNFCSKMGKMFKYNILSQNDSAHICWQSVSFICSDTNRMKKATSSLQSCSNNRGAGCLLLAMSIRTHCCFWFALFLPQVCSFLLKKNCFFHKLQGSKFPYHEPSTSRGRCSALFCQLPSQDKITYLSHLCRL